ncbi:MAG: hypothetical protein J5762_07985 [Clostridia bacterium]|nr:hypothetical protein [Clostridia bacterium]
MEKVSKKKILFNVILAISIVVTVASSFVLGYVVAKSSRQSELDDIEYIIGMYRKHNYDEEDDIVGVFASSLLDKYSAYYTAEQYEAIKNADAGKNVGIGITFDGSLTLTEINGNSPAERAGVKAGGTVKGLKLHSLNEYTYVSSLSDLSENLSAIAEGVEIDLLVDYDGVLKTFIVERREYLETYVDYIDASGKYGFSDASGKMEFVRLDDGDEELPADTAYIKYDWFNGTSSGLYGSAGQIEEALKAFKEGGKSKLIFDLRGNGGGFLNILESVASHFIDTDRVTRHIVCISKDKYGNEQKFAARAVDYADYGFEKIIILANSGTASASEAFIGAVLDYDVNDRVSVILEGRVSGGETYYKTYGKGIMQTTYERIGGGAIKLTTAKLFWPNGEISIHGVGITTELNDRYGGKILTESGYNKAYSDAILLCR